MIPVFEDEGILVLNKNSGIHVHPTSLSLGEDSLLSVSKRLRGEVNLFPVHRLDRATSGLVVFAKSREMAAELGNLFSTGQIRKRYLTLVRGWCLEPWTALGSVRDPWNDKRREAESLFLPRKRWELSFPLGRYETTRITLVEARPQTGRTHQLRQHLKQSSHPIIGDTRYGNGEYNRFFRDKFQWERLFLHAFALEFDHPGTGMRLKLRAPLDGPTHEFLTALGSMARAEGELSDGAQKNPAEEAGLLKTL